MSWYFLSSCLRHVKPQGFAQEPLFSLLRCLLANPIDAAGFRALDPIPAISPSLLKTSTTPVRDSIRQGVSWARDPESDSGDRTCNRILSTTTRMSGVASASRG